MGITRMVEDLGYADKADTGELISRAVATVDSSIYE